MSGSILFWAREKIKCLHNIPAIGCKKQNRGTISCADFPCPYLNKLMVQIKAVGIHDLVPGGYEVVDELLLGVCTGIHFAQSTQLRV